MIGIVDNSLRARLLREKDLTLDKAILMCRSNEITSLHLQKMTVTEEVHFNSSKKKDKGKKFVKRICSYCLESHERRKCPAFGHACSICHRKNHYEKACRDVQDTAQREKHQKKSKSRKKTYMVQEESTSESEVSSSYAVSNTTQRKAYFTDVRVKSPDTENYTAIKFQLDSASTGSTMKLEDYRKLTCKMPEKNK